MDSGLAAHGCLPDSFAKEFCKKRVIPNDWTIAIGSLTKDSGFGRYSTHHPAGIGDGSHSESPTKKFDTANIIFGIGRLFVHVFFCPDIEIVKEYRDFIGHSSLVQIHPLLPEYSIGGKGGLFWPILPELGASEASELAMAFQLHLMKSPRFHWQDMG